MMTRREALWSSATLLAGARTLLGYNPALAAESTEKTSADTPAAVHTGAALPGLLAAMRIPSRVVSEVDELRTSLVEARRSMDTSLHPVSIVLSGRITRG